MQNNFKAIKMLRGAAEPENEKRRYQKEKK